MPRSCKPKIQLRYWGLDSRPDQPGENSEDEPRIFGFEKRNGAGRCEP